MFLGEFQHTVDEKGRLAIPAKFRPSLAEGLVVTRGIDRCLYVWTLDRWQELAQRMSKLPIVQENARRITRHFFSGAVDTKMDKMGRIILPQYLREYAGLGGDAVVVGANTNIEIWSRERWEAEVALAEEQSSTLAEHLAPVWGEG
ncbi:MAG: division/cell wall cluster transcriptional repressor MraZ [Chloroflexota bacterium]